MYAKGSVSAATRWGGKRQTMQVNDAMTGSYEWYVCGA
jgi:hypothetical protein